MTQSKRASAPLASIVIVRHGDGENHGTRSTVDTFLAASTELSATVKRRVRNIRVGERIRGGGGAAEAWSIEGVLSQEQAVMRLVALGDHVDAEYRALRDALAGAPRVVMVASFDIDVERAVDNLILGAVSFHEVITQDSAVRKKIRKALGYTIP